MYRDEILELYKNPRNSGKIEDADVVIEGENPSCGDHLKLYINREENSVEVRHQSDACAICTASTSIVTEETTKLTEEEIKNLDKDWMLEKLGIEISPMRMKCALLGLETLQKGLKK